MLISGGTDGVEKYLDELSSESAHKYFRKFVRVCELS
jgi:hypothetical protein